MLDPLVASSASVGCRRPRHPHRHGDGRGPGGYGGGRDRRASPPGGNAARQIGLRLTRQLDLLLVELQLERGLGVSGGLGLHRALATAVSSPVAGGAEELRLPAMVRTTLLPGAIRRAPAGPDGGSPGRPPPGPYPPRRLPPAWQDRGRDGRDAGSPLLGRDRAPPGPASRRHRRRRSIEATAWAGRRHEPAGSRRSATSSSR